MNQHSAEELNIAILHDRFPQLGGGELVAIEAARVLDAPIYTMYVSEGVELPSDVEVIPLMQSKYTRGLSQFSLAWKPGGANPLEPVSVMIDMAGIEPLHAYDVVFESGPLSKSYVPQPGQTVLNYPHSPPRWLYDQYTQRLNRFGVPGVSFALKAFARLMRVVDKETNDYVDRFLANSEVVQNRIKRYYGRASTVVYPPVDDSWYHGDDEGYFLTWSRLVPNKRVSLIVRAFAELDEELLVAGDGEERATIEALAESHENIEVLGHVDDIQSLVAGCRAVVYAPREEDFGMVGAEALTAGKPLIGVDEGFTRFQIDPGVNGLLFEPTVSGIRRALNRFDAGEFTSGCVQATAAQYSRDEFETRLLKTVEAAYASPNASY
jgi:glycosyltransferase involved in cell wall biosynthesis